MSRKKHLPKSAKSALPERASSRGRARGREYAHNRPRVAPAPVPAAATQLEPAAPSSDEDDELLALLAQAPAPALPAEIPSPALLAKLAASSPRPVLRPVASRPTPRSVPPRRAAAVASTAALDTESNTAAYLRLIRSIPNSPQPARGRCGCLLTDLARDQHRDSCQELNRSLDLERTLVGLRRTWRAGGPPPAETAASLEPLLLALLRTPASAQDPCQPRLGHLPLHPECWMAQIHAGLGAPARALATLLWATSTPLTPEALIERGSSPEHAAAILSAVSEVPFLPERP